MADGPSIAFVGVAHWHAGMHAAAAQRAGARLVGAFDPDPGALARFRLGYPCAALGSLAAVIAARPDLVVVMGNPLEMPERLVRVAEAGLAVLTEKPVAPTGAALRPISARLGGAWVAAALPQRLSPLHGMREQLARQGRLGRISHASFRIINGPPARYRDDAVSWVLDPDIGGGGCLRNLGVHGMDSFCAIAGAQEVRVSDAAIGHLYGERVEDYAAVTLRAADGTIGRVEVGYVHASMAPGGDFEWRLAAANAYIRDSGATGSVATLDDETCTALPRTLTSGRYDELMADTLARLDGGQPPAATLADLQRAMDLIDTAYAMASSAGM
jgi:predicted dehydrogenase